MTWTGYRGSVEEIRLIQTQFMHYEPTAREGLRTNRINIFYRTVEGSIDSVNIYFLSVPIFILFLVCKKVMRCVNANRTINSSGYLIFLFIYVVTVFATY